MVEQEDTELTSSHRHIEITTIHRAPIDENDLKSSRKKIYNQLYKDDWEVPVQHTELSCDDLEGWNGEGGGRLKGRRYMNTYMADSHYRTAEAKTAL